MCIGFWPSYKSLVMGITWHYLSYSFQITKGFINVINVFHVLYYESAIFHLDCLQCSASISFVIVTYFIIWAISKTHVSDVTLFPHERCSVYLNIRNVSKYLMEHIALLSLITPKNRAEINYTGWTSKVLFNCLALLLVIWEIFFEDY